MNHSVVILAQQDMDVIDLEAAHPAACPCALCFAGRSTAIVPHIAVEHAIVLDSAVEHESGKVEGLLKRRGSYLDKSRNALRRERFNTQAWQSRTSAATAARLLRGAVPYLVLCGSRWEMSAPIGLPWFYSTQI